MESGSQRTFRYEDWNILSSRWLRLQSNEAEEVVASPLEALADAKRLRCIAFPSPVDSFAAYRFLLTLLYWKADKGGGVQALRASLLRGEIPTAVRESLRADDHYFRLFDETVPFLQDTSITKRKDTKSAGSFFPEMATGTNIAHFHHGDDNKLRLCLACVTLGLIRVVPWSQAGGAGITPSVHGAPPIMALATGGTLAETLGLNLVSVDAPIGHPHWSGKFAPANPNNPIPLLEALSWNPRRLLLPPPEDAGPCWGCGSSGVLTVGRLCYQKNEETKKPTGGTGYIWQDPAAFYPVDKPFSPVKSTDKVDGKTAAHGIDMVRLTREGKLHACHVAASNPEHRTWALVIPCTSGKDAKTFDHRQVALETLTPESVRSAGPTSESRAQHERGRDGFALPPIENPPLGILRLVRAANENLNHTDWIILRRAAFKSLDEAPAAFDLFAGIYWPLRKRHAEFPARHTVWLFLKLMAAVPDAYRVNGGRKSFCPLSRLPRRQLSGYGTVRKPSPYPIGLPRGHHLEAALRTAVAANLRNRPPAPFDWAGFCHRLSKLID